MKLLVWMIAISIGACAGNKSEPTTTAPAPAPTTSPTEAAPAGSGSAASCAAEGGKCINKAAAVSCGTKSHDGGCPETGASYCCIR
jgi:hypothetical protein